MAIFLKKFSTTAEYEAYIVSEDKILPNVSMCEDTPNTVHYTPLVKVTSVTLNKNELSLSNGETETLVATVLPSNANNKNVTWSSSNDSVATVSNNGLVTAVGDSGNADITVTTEDGEFTAMCAVSIKNNKAITYTATAKLRETAQTGNVGYEALHINSFSGTSGQKLTMVSHTFEDGVGTVTFDGDIETIGYYAFSYCSGLTSIDIPDSVTSIDTGAFWYCSGLTRVNSSIDGVFNIPSGVTSIGNSVFSYCTSLTSITISDSVTNIGFYYCYNLKRVNSDTDGVFNIPSGVTSIGSNAFYFCSGMTSINIPSGVTSIGNSAFTYCSGLTSIDMSDNVTSIGYRAFYGCSSLTSITIPSGVTSISLGAFSNCSSLTSIDIPSGVTTIGDYAFYYCSGLTSVTIGSGVTSIGDSAFRNCSGLTSIDIPSGVTSISGGAFQDCSSLISITSNATTAPTIGSNTFYNIKTGGTLYVPSGSSGYNVWMGTGYYYLGYYYWTKVEQ